MRERVTNEMTNTFQTVKYHNNLFFALNFRIKENIDNISCKTANLF